MQFASRILVVIVLFALAPPAHAAGTITSEHDRAFGLLTEPERVKLEPTLQQLYLKNGQPSRELQYTLIRIDTEKLKAQLQGDWNAAQAGQVTRGIPFPLFGDNAIAVKVDQVIRNDVHGMTAYFGHAVTDVLPRFKFTAFFTDNGQLNSVVRTGQGSYSTKYIRDFDNYVIIAREETDRDFD